jgi:hypothetical protein
MDLNKENVEYIQSACNPVAVANLLAKWTKEVADTQGGHPAVVKNELLRAVVGKLCDMYGIEHDSMFTYEALAK